MESTALLHAEKESRKFHDIPGFQVQMKYTLLICFGALSIGFLIGFPVFATSSLQVKGFISEKEASWFVSLASFGTLLGCPLGGLSADKYGRKLCLLLSTFPSAIGWLLIISAQHVAMLYTGRFLTGIGRSMLIVTGPIFVSEITSREVRGIFMTFIIASIHFGMLMAYILGAIIDWQWLAVVCLMSTVLTAITNSFFPETPKWLLKNQQRDDAIDTLCYLRSATSKDQVMQEIEEIERTLDMTKDFSIKDLKSPAVYRPVGIILALVACKQLSGFSVVITYTDYIFQNAGFQANGAMPTILVGIMFLVATPFATIFIDYKGRRFLLIVSGTIVAMSCAAFGLYFMYPSVGNWLSITSLCVYSLAGSAGLIPVVTLLISELVPLRVRGSAGGMAVLIETTIDFILHKEFYFMVDTLAPYVVFWIFGGFCVIGIFITIFFLPETKGRSLEDIERCFM